MLASAMLGTDAALQVGLVDQVTDDMDAALADQQAKVLAAAPQALATIKRQLAALPFQTRAEQRQMAADTFADAMLSDEAREGISAFFDKRKPNWAGG